MSPGEAEISVGCVIRAAPGQLTEGDVHVERIDQLQAELDLEDGEELVSNILSIQTKANDLQVKNLRPYQYTTITSCLRHLYSASPCLTHVKYRLDVMKRLLRPVKPTSPHSVLDFT